MNKIFKRIFSAFLATVIAFSIIPFNLIEASATQSRIDNISNAYTLTGNGATDMISIAFAQEGKNGSSLGYSDEWCARFICDCAISANQGAAIPYNGDVFELKKDILDAGGLDTTSSPQPGDICFIHWGSTGSSYDHAEIVYSVSGSNVNTIGGNAGEDDPIQTLYTRTVKRHTPINSIDGAHILCIVRPAYKTANIATITFNSAGGTAVASITQDVGTPITAPSDPTRTGGIFMRWYPDVPSTMPAENLICVAWWCMLGDINENGDINVIDALMALQGITGVRALTPLQRLVADVSRDSRVSVLDALIILQYCSGIVTYPYN